MDRRMDRQMDKNSYRDAKNESNNDSQSHSKSDFVPVDYWVIHFNSCLSLDKEIIETISVQNTLLSLVFLLIPHNFKIGSIKKMINVCIL